MSQNKSNSSSSTGAMDSAMEKLMERGFSEMERAERDADHNDGKTTKLFGIFDVPTAFATVVEGVWNEGAHEFTEWLREHSDPAFTTAGKTLGLKGKGLVRGVAIATIATSTTIKALPFINPIFESFRDHHNKQRDLARKIAPVLNDVKGNHSVGALMAVNAGENEMIYAHRRRMSMTADTDNMNNLIKLAVNVVPGFVSDLPHARAKWGDRKEVAVKSKKDLGDSAKKFGGRVARIGASPVATVLINSNKRNLKKKFSSDYSALDMVVTLEEQVEHNPKAHAFQLPGKHSESLSLEEYVVRILQQHQKDMADLTHDHTELRAALKDDMVEVAKPLAEAIRNGDMSALAMIRLVGEGKIIKNKGRAICTPEEVEGMIQHDKPKAHKYTTVDSKEYYANATFTKKELENALKHLSGDEKQVFASMFPDSILEEAGMKKGDVEHMRTALMERYDHHLAEAVSGVASQTDDQLKKQGLAGHEIKQIRKAADKLATQGEKAIHELKSGPTNANGIERAMLNLAVPQVNGDKAYFGAMMAKGREEVKNLPEVPVTDTAPKKHGTGTSANELADKENYDMDADDAMDGFADREDDRRSQGSSTGKTY